MGWTDKVADAAIGWIVQSILGSFFTQQMQVWAKEIGLTEDVAMLESEMKNVKVVLGAAKGRRIDNRALSDALNELKELLYDAEDVMDELDYYRLQQQIEGKSCNAPACINPEGSSGNSDSSSIYQRGSRIMNQIMHGKKRRREEEPAHSIMLPHEIKHDISERINAIVKHLRIRGKSVQRGLQLEFSGHHKLSKQTQSMSRRPRLTTSIPIERKVYGRDAEKDRIIELLTNRESGDLGVLPLVGVGGVGKTTLAKFVYHDQRIKDHFDLRMWVCVSDNFDVGRLTSEMLQLLSEETQDYKNTSPEALQHKLRKKIRGKRFLLVLDDIWEDQNRSKWDLLLGPLNFNEANGCMILATTRGTSVATMIGTMEKVDVNSLCETEFWSLFKAWAFLGNENKEGDRVLQSIGKQIAKELKGNPLAARSVGALLNSDVCFDHWREVQHKWKSLLEKDDDILQILKLSYDCLPVRLQKCFSYCSLFPKDHTFTWEMLVHSWISQNFVKCKNHAKRLEETGKQYLKCLVDWGFFEEDGSYYVMHDLMHDLAQNVSSNECATVGGLESKRISPNIQHLSIITTGYNTNCRDFPDDRIVNILQNMVSLQKLRTLMFFDQRCAKLLSSSPDLFRELKRLRLLRIYVTREDVSSTLNMFKPYHLRYLELTVLDDHFPGFLNRSIFIPQALTQFYHLQVLDPSDNYTNFAVPTDMNKLVNLRHLIGHEDVHSEIASVGNMTSLQELKFKVQDDDDFNIGQLGSMNELVTLEISQLENVKTKEGAKSARLIDKEHLQELSLSWDYDIMSAEATAEELLDGLEPHPNLKHLELTRYSGGTSPTWLASKLTSLQVLHLDSCGGWRIVHLDMLSFLRKLKLKSMRNLIEVSVPPYLEEFILDSLPQMEKCVGTYGQDLTSCLKVLIVTDCPQLKDSTLFHSDHFPAELNSWFPSLEKLTIRRCHHRIMSWTTLPLEEMQALKELELMGVPAVEELLVPSLEKLVLEKMPSLKSCSGITAPPTPQFSTSQVDRKELTSSLRKLSIHDCPSLIVSPHILPPVSDLSIKGHPAFPAMELRHGRFTIKSDYTNFRKLIEEECFSCLEGNESLKFLMEKESYKLTELDGSILPLHILKDIRFMYLEDCPNLIRISREVLSQLIALEKLSIENCPVLGQPHVMSERVHEDSTSNTKHPVLPSLKSLNIDKCGISSGRWLTQMLPHLQSLEVLELEGSPSSLLVMSQPTDTEENSSLASPETPAWDEHLLEIPCNILHSLKKLRIYQCPYLEFYGGNGGFGRFTSLVDLDICRCPKLLSSPAYQMNNVVLFPTSIQRLTIIEVELQFLSLEGLTHLIKLGVDLDQLGALEGLQHLNSLQSLDINMNPVLSAAWDLKLQEQEQAGGSPNQVELFPLSLRELRIKKLRCRGVHSRFLCLPSVTKLRLEDSSELVSLQLGYCTSLEELEIWYCKSLASIEGLQSVTNLRSLLVWGSPGVLSEPEAWSRLEALQIDDPSILSTSLCKHLTSLRHLELFCDERMVSLTEDQESALVRLTSLRKLSFYYCDNLESLPACLRSLDSLEELHIEGCQRIQRLPELPSSLNYLSVVDCSSQLESQCRMAETEKLIVYIPP